MKKKYRVVIAVVATVFAAVIGRIALDTEQTKVDPEPLVINTVEDQDDIVLTVVRGDETVFQYSGDIELWKGEDGKAYGIIYIDDEVLQ